MNPKKPNYDEEFSRHLEYAEHMFEKNVETENGINKEEVRKDEKKK